MKKNVKICKKCIMDSSTPDFYLDKNGICNYCKLRDQLEIAFPNNKQGQKELSNLFKKIRLDGKNKKYDCIIGVSGGTDSTYLLHLAKKQHLKPLAVHLDNGWNSEISTNNLKRTLDKLKIDLDTHVVYWPEMKDILLSFLKASLPWADGPTDIAIVSNLYKQALKHKIKYILVGNNFRTEGKQPDAWTHIDGRQLLYIQKHFGTKKLKTFPNLTASNLIYYGIKKIKMIKPLYYIPYNKNEVKKFITKEYGWQDYGEHHHESIFTRFIIGCWLPQKFNIDKRKVTYSALIRSGEMKRYDALKKIKELPYDKKRIEEDKQYIIKKLGINEKEFIKIWNKPNKKFTDFPSYYPFYKKFQKIIDFFLFKILPNKPLMSFKDEHN